jgi:hypothetical protein
MEWNTIIAHPGLKFGPLSNNNLIDPLQYVSIIQLIFYIAVCVTLIALAIRVKVLFEGRSGKMDADEKKLSKVERRAKYSKYNVAELFEKLKTKFPDIKDVKIYFGGKRRFNKHFLYRVKTKMVQFPKNWETEKSFAIEFWTIYNFANLVDIRTSSLNYVTKSLWPNFLMILGLTLSSLNILLTCILPIDQLEIVGALNYGLGWGVFTLFGVSTICIVVAWVWWFTMSGKKMKKFVAELTRNVLTEEERTRLLKLYSVFSAMPLLINVVVRELPSKSMVWDKYDSEELRTLILKSEFEAKEAAMKKSQK